MARACLNHRSRPQARLSSEGRLAPHREMKLRAGSPVEKSRRSRTSRYAVYTRRSLRAVSVIPPKESYTPVSPPSYVGLLHGVRGSGLRLCVGGWLGWSRLVRRFGRP